MALTPEMSRLAVWIADVLPNEIAPTIAKMIEQGLATMKATLEG